MPISQAIGGLIHDWGGLIMIMLAFGTGEVVVRVLDGRRRLSKEKGMTAGLRAANASLTRQLDHALGLAPTDGRWEDAGGDAKC